jgi:hypothetical protein
VAREHLVGLVVADAGHDRSLVRALAERELVAAHCAVVAVGDAVVRGELRALVFAAEDEVHDARNRVGAVHRRCAVGQHLDALDHVRRDVVRVRAEEPVAVDQDQRALRAEPAKADRRDAVAAAVVDLRIRVRSRDDRKILHEIAERELPRLPDRRAVDRDDRVRRLDVDAPDLRAGDGDRFELLVGRMALRRVLRERRHRDEPERADRELRRDAMLRMDTAPGRERRAHRITKACLQHGDPLSDGSRAGSGRVRPSPLLSTK